MEGADPRDAEIRNLMADMTCSHDFDCCQADFRSLKPADIVGEDCIFCLDEQAKICDQSAGFGDGRICLCPLRKYIAKKWRR